MGKLTGKTALITGGNSGIGLATAKTFIDEGARVVIFGRDAAKLARAKETLGERASTVEGDVTDADDLARLVATTEGDLGKLDIVFVNAGVAEFEPLVDADEAHFDKLFDIKRREPGADRDADPRAHEDGEEEQEQEQVGKSLLSRVPLDRMGRPAEIAKSVPFLASDDSGYVVGAELVVDGGMSQL